MSIRTIAAALLLGGAVLAQPASAASYLITYTGTVSSGYDQTDVFGLGGTDLTGQAFKAVYTLTDPTPGAYVYNDGFAGYTYGGTDYGAGIPSPLSAKITINGITKAISGDQEGFAYQVDGLLTSSGYDQVYHFAYDYLYGGSRQTQDYLYNSVYSYVNNIVDTSNYTTPLDYSAQAGDSNNYGYFQFYDYNYVTGIYDQYASGSLTNERVTINLVSGVPEPATWAMMLTGFGLVGGAMRRKARMAVSFA